MTELKQAKHFLAERLPAGAAVLAAVSGGLDSMCLLYFAADRGLCVTAAHFNHQLRGENADGDEAFVRDWCRQNGIPFVSGSGDTRAFAAENGLSLEEAARTLRYNWLEAAAETRHCGYILTAHHADDNAETLLLNLLRGTGLKGLTGIPPVRGRLLRPFLGIPKAELVEYAEERHLPHREDETNALDDASRNLLRHRVLPVLKDLNPRAVEHITQAMERLAEDEAVLAADAAALTALARPIPGGFRLARAALQSFPPALQKRAVLRLLADLSGQSQNWSASHAEAAVQLAESENGAAVLSLPYGMTARFCDGDLRFTRAAPSPEEMEIALGETVSFGNWDISLSPQSGDYPLAVARLSEPLRVTLWRREDRLTLPGARGPRSLKRLCLDRGLSPPERDALAVLRMGEIPVAAAGIGENACFAPQAGEAAVFVKFKWNAEKEESNHDQ
ncbi:MAG: tRNA lysidine(34) synthetase TilS [Oscillibacter sp.]